MDSWASDWPRCLLLLELATRYAESGRAHGCAKLKDRLEDWRRRMDDAPPPVHALLSELCYVCWLLERGQHLIARHHVAEAQRKTKEIGRMLRRAHYESVWRQASVTRGRAFQLKSKARDLWEQSELLLAQAATLRRRASPEAASAREAPDSELVSA